MQLYIGNSESNALASRVLVRAISKIALLVESNKEVQSPTGKHLVKKTFGQERIHLVKIIVDDLERSQLYMVMTAMLVAIVAAILDLENIFRFTELLLKNKVIWTKYPLTSLLNCGYLSPFAV